MSGRAEARPSELGERSLKTINASSRRGARVDAKSSFRKCYFLPAALRRAAQRAFIASESFLRPAAVRPRLFPGAFFVVAPPPALRRAAQRAFIASESFLRPAAVNPLRRPEVFAADGALAAVPLRLAQRARAAAASFARVAGDIGRRLRRERRPPLGLLPPEEVVEPPKRVDNRSSSAPICFLIESACVSCCRDRSMVSVDSFPRRNCKRNTAIT
jgi:hypothetical protein